MNARAPSPWIYSEPTIPAGYTREDWETCSECRGGGCHDCDFNGGWPAEPIIRDVERIAGQSCERRMVA